MKNKDRMNEGQEINHKYVRKKIHNKKEKKKRQRYTKRLYKSHQT